MPDLDIYPAPGEDVVVHAPAGTTFTKPSINTRKDRIRAHNTGTYVPPQPEAPPVEPPPVIVPQPTVRAFNVGGTDDQLVALARDLSIDIIDWMGGTYPKWGPKFFLDVARPSDAKLLIRPRGNVILDGTGTVNTPPARIGWSTKASYITLAPSGTGSFTAQNYRLGKAGVVMARYFDHLTFDGLTVKGCYGDKSIDSTLGPQHTHAVYIMGGDGQFWQSNGWTVEGPASRYLNGFQTDGTPNADHLIVKGWKVSSCHRAVYAWADPTDLVIDGWDIADCTVTIDTPGQARGVVSDMRSVNSGPMAPGQGSWKGTLLVSGGGNTAS